MSLEGESIPRENSKSLEKKTNHWLKLLKFVINVAILQWEGVSNRKKNKSNILAVPPVVQKNHNTKSGFTIQTIFKMNRAMVGSTFYKHGEAYCYLEAVKTFRANIFTSAVGVYQVIFNVLTFDFKMFLKYLRLCFIIYCTEYLPNLQSPLSTL